MAGRPLCPLRTQGSEHDSQQTSRPPLHGGGSAACGSGGRRFGSSSGASTATAKAAGGSRDGQRREDAGLGKILVDSPGRTLYLWLKDSGSKSACSGSSPRAWPPLLASGEPTAGGGAKASLLGTLPSDGKPQVAYDGHPLYGFQGDSKPGDTTGQGSTGFQHCWYVLSTTGKDITTAASSSGGSNGY